MQNSRLEVHGRSHLLRAAHPILHLEHAPAALSSLRIVDRLLNTSQNKPRSKKFHAELTDRWYVLPLVPNLPKLSLYCSNKRTNARRVLGSLIVY